MIPKPPGSAARALVDADPLKLTKQVHEYVSHMYHATDKTVLPSQIEFAAAASASLNIRDKFSLLQDVKDGGFYDVLGQVVKRPFDYGDRMTLWVSDYSENSTFFPYVQGGQSYAPAGDPMGYTNGVYGPMSSGWEGPYGKRSIQITAYDPHADFIRSNVKAGDYIQLRNLQVKFGRSTSNLEGFLRGDQRYKNKINVTVIDPRDKESPNQQVKDVLQRKLQYLNEEKAQKRDIASGGQGGKRKSTEDNLPKGPNAKQRRQMLRKQQQIEEKEEKSPILNLNPEGKSSFSITAFSNRRSNLRTY
jgi:hypothetical protein